MEATNKSLNIKEKLIAPKLLLLFFLSIAIFVCYALRDVAFMLVLSYMVAYIIDPALDFLKTKKIPRNIGVFMMVAFLILLVVLFFLVLTPYFIKEISILQNKIPDIIKFFQNNFEKCIAYAQTKFPNFKVDDFSQNKIFSMITTEHIQKFLHGVTSTLLAGYSYTMALVNACLFPIFAYYFCVDFDKINKAFFNLIPRQYKKGLNKIRRCLDLYKLNQDITQDILRDVHVIIYLKSPLNTFVLLQDLLNQDMVKAFEIKPKVLLYMLADKKYRADKIFKLPSEKVRFIQDNVSLVYLSKGHIK